MSAKGVSELVKALLHSGAVCTKRIKLNNGIETIFAAHSVGLTSIFIPYSESDHTIKVQFEH